MICGGICNENSKIAAYYLIYWQLFYAISGNIDVTTKKSVYFNIHTHSYGKSSRDYWSGSYLKYTSF